MPRDAAPGSPWRLIASFRAPKDGRHLPPPLTDAELAALPRV